MIDCIIFPALVISNKFIDFINYRHFVSDKRLINSGKGYKNVSIVDSSGNFFKMNGVRQIGGVSIWDSIKVFGIMVKVEPILQEPVRKIALDELRNIIINILERNPNKFSNLDSKDSLIESIKTCETINDVINLFG